MKKSHKITREFCLGGVQAVAGHLAKPSRQMALKKSLSVKDQSCPTPRWSHKATWWRT